MPFRFVFSNLHKAMAYVLAVDVPIAGMALAAGATGIAWFELFKWARGRKRAGSSA